MGVDDEYKMVSAGDDANDHLLDRTAPISRSTYKKRNMFVSIAIGALIGAGLTFVFSLLFAPSGYTAGRSSTAADKVETAAPVLAPTATATVTVTAPAAALPIATEGSTIDATLPQADIVVPDAEHTQDAAMTDCGNTPDEARAKGCVFDVMMQLWTPPACFDQALTDRYLSGGNWTWWADPEATRSLTLDEMKKGEHPVIYVIQDYHKSHCIFAWEKLVRAMRNEWPLIEELVSYDHVMHCKHRTLSKDSDDVRGVRAPTGYTRCGLYKHWEGRLPSNAASSTD